jgi:putative membrane protein insertion efficiency factor
MNNSKINGMIRSALVQILILAVRMYQVCLRPLFPSVCRFYPSCSEYFIQSVQINGPWRGSWRGFLRLCRCHPWHPGGYDPP